MKKILLASLFALTLFTPALAEDKANETRDGYVTTEKTITFSPGGSILEFIEQYNRDRMSHLHYKIDGMCISACTLILGLMPDKDVCTTDRGVMAFHSASRQTMLGDTHSPEATKLIGQMYPKAVRDLLRERGFDVDEGQEHPELIYIPANTFYKECNG